MSFLGKLGKDLGTAAEKAKFEADKALKLNRLGSELGGLNNQVQQATAAVGAKVMELHVAGTLQVPELESLFTNVESLKAQVAAKQAEIDAVKAMAFGAGAAAAAAPPAGGPAPSGFTYAQGQTPAAGAPPKFCPGCGTASGGASFCPSCGQKLA
jgi:hypothetical protein